MKGALIILAVVVVVGVILYLHHRFLSNDKVENKTQMSEQDSERACCGMHIMCEKDSLLSAVSSEVIYYEDEELDEFKGREPEDYSSEEIERFREVLLTLLPQDIAGWGRSIQLRGINLPSEVREELLMIVSEARQKS